MPMGLAWSHCDLRARVHVKKVASVLDIFSLDNNIPLHYLSLVFHKFNLNTLFLKFFLHFQHFCISFDLGLGIYQFVVLSVRDYNFFPPCLPCLNFSFGQIFPKEIHCNTYDFRG